MPKKVTTKGKHGTAWKKIPKKNGWLKSFKVGKGLSGETKAVDLPVQVYQADTTGTVQAVNLIRTGTSFTNRIGRKVCLKSLYLTGQWAAEAAGALNVFARLVVVYDSQPNGALPTWSDVMKCYDQSTTGTSASSYDQINMDNRDRFRILMDERKVLPATAAGISDGNPSPTANELLVQRFIPLHNLETQYKADSSPAVIGDISTGSLLILTLGDAAVASGWQFYGTVRLRFTDC